MWGRRFSFDAACFAGLGLGYVGSKVCLRYCLFHRLRLFRGMLGRSLFLVVRSI